VNPAFGDAETLPPIGSIAGPGGSEQGPVSTNWVRVVALREGLNIVQVSATDYAGNVSQIVTLQITHRPIDPLNDQFVNAIPLENAAGTNSINTARATKETGEPLHAGNVGGKSAWWTFTPPQDGVLLLSTTNSTFDTLLAVYTGSSVSQLTEVMSNDDAFEGSRFSKVQFGVSTSQVYRIAVDGFGGDSGVVFLTHEFGATNLVSLTVSNTVGGVVTPGSGLFPVNTTISLTAIPNTGYDFVGWEGSITSTANPLSLMITSNTTLIAHFGVRSVSDDFSSGDLSKLSWQTPTNGGWFVETVPNIVAAAAPGSSNSIVVRELPSDYRPNARLIVRLNVTPAAGVGAYFVDEVPPQTFIPSTLSHRGTINGSTRKLRWGPFFDGQPRTLSYELTPPANAAGIVSFEGSGTFDGVVVPTSGARQTVLYAARSGRIQGGQTTILTLVTNTPAGSGSFDLRVSSELNWDYLEFYLNDVLVQRWSGEQGWSTYQFVTPAGTNRMEWRYTKDAINDAGLDAAFITNVNLPTEAPVGPAAPAELSIVQDGTIFQIRLVGQVNQQYILEASPNFLQWQAISTNTATDGIIFFVDPDAPNYTNRFYRALSQ
jgi:hypothetical protein